MHTTLQIDTAGKGAARSAMLRRRTEEGPARQAPPGPRHGDSGGVTMRDDDAISRDDLLAAPEGEQATTRMAEYRKLASALNEFIGVFGEVRAANEPPELAAVMTAS